MHAEVGLNKMMFVKTGNHPYSNSEVACAPKLENTLIDQ